MVIVKCDKCGKEVAWYCTENLPGQWEGHENRELCGDCAEKFRAFREALDAQRIIKIDKYFEGK